jgi:peptidoglycan/LPS O-acetylase OafA/YrhL
VSIGLVISPLLTVLTDPLRDNDLNDATTLFSIWQRIAGSLGVGVIVALFASQARNHGAVAALHTTGVLLAVIAVIGVLAAPLLPAVRVPGHALGAAGQKTGPATAGGASAAIR